MLRTKVCCDCKVEKEFSEFTVDKRSTTGTTCRCKVCTKEYMQAYYQQRREEILDKKRAEYVQKGKLVHYHLFEEAKAIGIELVGEDRRMSYAMYKLPCGHTVSLKYCQVRSGKAPCKICTEELQAFQAMYRGLVLNFSGKKCEAGYRNYTFPCGHSKDLRTAHVADGNFRCKVCQELRNEQNAEINGLLLLGEASNSDPNYREYTLPCGCTRDLRVVNVEKGVWVCRDCNAGYFGRKSTIYLIRFKTLDFSWLKLGFSYSVADRIRDYKLSEPYSFEIVFSKEIDTGKSALLLEKEIHRRLKNKKLPAELMKKFHSKSGYTECYEDGMEDLITKETEEVLREYGKETKNQ